MDPQRDADQTLLDLFPFAVDATLFRETFQSRVAIVRSEVTHLPPPPHTQSRIDFSYIHAAQQKSPLFMYCVLRSICTYIKLD
jgi:hypothetical protein